VPGSWPVPELRRARAERVGAGPAERVSGARERHVQVAIAGDVEGELHRVHRGALAVDFATVEAGAGQAGDTPTSGARPRWRVLSWCHRAGRPGLRSVGRKGAGAGRRVAGRRLADERVPGADSHASLGARLSNTSAVRSAACIRCGRTWGGLPDRAM
jgi:hypothetical protein